MQISWSKKIPLVSDGQEKAWLFHELGRCYLELGGNEEARDFGVRSLAAADEISDEKWQIMAIVLISQAECKYLCHIFQYLCGVFHVFTVLQFNSSLSFD